MELTTRQKLGLGVGYTLLVFAFGRYSSTPAKVSTQVTEKQHDTQTEAKDVHTKKTVTETKRPDGTDTIVTTVDQNVIDDKKEQTDTTIQSKQTVVPPQTINISILGANDFSQGRILPTYGLSVTKPVLGPLTIGAFGLMNGTIGVSVGVNF
jgi:hypothetical protein